MKVGGKAQPGYIFVIHKLGIIRNAKGDPTGAESYLREARELTKAVSGNASEDYALATFELGVLFPDRKGDVSIGLLRESIDVYAKAVGKEHPAYIKALEALALQYNARGDRAHSEPLLRGGFAPE